MILTIIKVVFIVLDVVLVCILVFSLVKSWQFRPEMRLSLKRPRKMPTLKNVVFKEHWQSILEKSKSAEPESVKIAIIEADALVGDILKQMGYEGEHLADKLAKLSPQDFPSVEKLWQAHRIRNEMVHTPGFQISAGHAQDMIAVYEKFLKEVNVL